MTIVPCGTLLSQARGERPLARERVRTRGRAGGRANLKSGVFQHLDALLEGDAAALRKVLQRLEGVHLIYYRQLLLCRKTLRNPIASGSLKHQKPF